MKYPQRMARPRQWGKKFTNIHTELRAAYGNYQKRNNRRKNFMAIGRQASRYKANFHKNVWRGRSQLYKTPKWGPPSGKKIWRRF